MDPQLLKRLNALRGERKAAVLVTDMGDGRDRLVQPDDPVPGELGEAIAAALRAGRSGPVTAGGREFLLSVERPAPRLVIVGAVHSAQALSAMAPHAGLAVEVIDPRSAFAAPERFAGVSLDPRWPQEVFAERPLDRWCALAALTHDPKIDDDALIAALAADCLYIGALGSRKSHAKRLKRLEERGISPAALSRILGPIGMDIGAATPGEIAVSILAEVIARLHQRL